MLNLILKIFFWEVSKRNENEYIFLTLNDEKRENLRVFTNDTGYPNSTPFIQLSFLNVQKKLTQKENEYKNFLNQDYEIFILSKIRNKFSLEEASFLCKKYGQSLSPMVLDYLKMNDPEVRVSVYHRIVTQRFNLNKQVQLLKELEKILERQARISEEISKQGIFVLEEIETNVLNGPTEGLSRFRIAQTMALFNPGFYGTRGAFQSLLDFETLSIINSFNLKVDRKSTLTGIKTSPKEVKDFVDK